MLYSLFVSTPCVDRSPAPTATSLLALSAPWAALLAAGVALHLGLPDLASASGSAIAWAVAQAGLGAIFVLSGVGGLTTAFAQRHRQLSERQTLAQLPGGHERVNAILARRGPGAALIAETLRRSRPVTLAALRKAEQLDLSTRR